MRERHRAGFYEEQLNRLTKKQRIYVFLILSCLCVFVISYFILTRGTPLELGLHKIRVGEQVLRVQMATTPTQWHTGLSFRKELAADEGMLFVFNETQVLNFSTRDTYVPLGIAFIADDCVIREVQKMDISTYNRYRSSQPARAALEAPINWFEKNANVIGWIVTMSEVNCPDNWPTCCSL